jgi:hypothetical protein
VASKAATCVWLTLAVALLIAAVTGAQNAAALAVAAMFVAGFGTAVAGWLRVYDRPGIRRGIHMPRASSAHTGRPRAAARALLGSER